MDEKKLKKDKAAEFVTYEQGGHGRNSREAESQKWSEQEEQHWSWLRPFVNGGLAGFFPGFVLNVPLAAIFSSPAFAHFADMQRNPKYTDCIIKAQACPNRIVNHTFSRSLLLGLFEIVRNKSSVKHDGMTLTLSKEAVCGSTAGAAEAYLWYPLSLACLPRVDPKNRSVLQPAKYRNIFQVLYSMAANKNVSAIWENARSNVKLRTASNVGILVSYNPTICYLRDSVGLSETRAQLGASVVSAYLETACVVPLTNVLALRKFGDDPLDYLKSRPLAVFRGSSRHFASWRPAIMMMWFAFEHDGKSKHELDCNSR